MTLREWLGEAPFALAMSSGFFGFFAHSGMLSVLEREGFAPERVAGSSAGALVAGAWASGVTTAQLEDRLGSVRREDFWDPGIGLGVLRGAKFRRILENLLTVDAIEDTHTPLAISVVDVIARRVEVLDRGPLAMAIHASCAVPFMFHPVMHRGRALIDGGVLDRPGLAGLAGAPRVLFHHLVSRRASHVAPPSTPPGTITLVIEGLPRVDPFRLERGVDAFRRAADATEHALATRIQDRLVRIAG